MKSAMSAFLNESESPPHNPTFRIAIGWILVALAFLLSFSLGSVGGDAERIGQKIGAVLGAWMFMTFVAWLITRNRTPSAKANGRIVVGVLLLLNVVAGVGIEAQEREVAKAFMRDALALNQRHDARFLELGNRFDKASISDILTPPNLTSPAGIAKGRTLIAQNRALVAERGALLQTNLDEVKSLVRSLPPGDVKTGAESTMGAKLKETAALFTDLEHAQLAQYAAIEKILDWCAVQGGRLRNEGGQIRVSSPAQSIQLKALFDELIAIENKVESASKVVVDKSERMQTKRAENIKTLNKLLEK